MKIKSFVIGMVLGMVGAVVLVETVPAVKQFVDKGKKKIKTFFSKSE